MTPEERREYSKEYYLKNKDKIAKQQAKKYANMSPKKRKASNAKQAAYEAAKRANMSPAEKEVYLAKQAAITAAKYANLTSAEKEVYLAKLVVKRANMTSSEKKKRNTSRKKYLKTSTGKLAVAKCLAKRKRDLDYIPLNKWFKGSEGHHINDTYVIYIPKKLHKANLGHSHRKPETMIKINIEAFKFMNPDVYSHLVEDYTMKF